VAAKEFAHRAIAVVHRATVPTRPRSQQVEDRVGNGQFGRLQFRQWNKGDAASVSPWVTKMNIVIQESDPNYPFRLVPARTDGSAKQQVVLTIEAGSESEDSGTRTSTTFVARNSSIASPSNVDSVTAGVSDTKVCTITGWEMRP